MITIFKAVSTIFVGGVVLLTLSASKAAAGRLVLNQPTFAEKPILATSAWENAFSNTSAAHERAQRLCSLMGFNGKVHFDKRWVNLEIDIIDVLQPTASAPQLAQLWDKPYFRADNGHTYFVGVFSWVICEDEKMPDLNNSTIEARIGQLFSAEKKMSFSEPKWKEFPFIAVTPYENSKGEFTPNQASRARKVCRALGYNEAIYSRLRFVKTSTLPTGFLEAAIVLEFGTTDISVVTDYFEDYPPDGNHPAVFDSLLCRK
jgi:hypothetical protein